MTTSHSPRPRSIYRRLFLSALCGLCLIWISGCDLIGMGDNSPIKPYKGSITLSSDQQAFLLLAARNGLESGKIPPFPDALANVEGAGATVEVFLPPNNPVITVVGGSHFQTAFTEAIQKTASHPQFTGIIKPGLDKARIKIGVITTIEDIPDSEGTLATICNDISRQVEPGIHGLIFVEGGLAVHYQIPEMPIYKGWTLNKDQRITGGPLLCRQLEEFSSEFAGERLGWRGGDIFSFTTFTFIDSAKKRGVPVISYRAKTMIPPLTGESVTAAARANADYLARSVDPKTGRFAYVYYPGRDEYDPDYNIVRHAGTVYALFEAYNVFGDRKYFDAGRKALDYLMQYSSVPDQAPHIAIITQGGKSKLGTNALAALVFAVMPEEFMTARDREYRDKFGESILFHMMPKKGLFYKFFKQAVNKAAPKKQPLYYPGESMLALVRLYEKTGDKKWWNAAKEIAPVRKELWLSAGQKEVGSYCWEGQAFARMAVIEQDPAVREGYTQAAWSHADAVVALQFQPGKNRYPDYAGGANNSIPPRTTATSARAESLMEAYRLARYLGDAKAQKKYGAALLHSVRFFTENQFADENSWYLPYPEKALGGIRESLIANAIRIDYNQHALLVALNFIEPLKELKKMGMER